MAAKYGLEDADLKHLEDVDRSDDPLCYICNSEVMIGLQNPRLKQGLHESPSISDEKIWRHAEWHRYYRMILFHPRKDICHLSGTSYLTKKDHKQTVQVPWDENTLAIRPFRPHTDKRFATALNHDIGNVALPDRLVGIMLHFKCWQMLEQHQTWSVCGGHSERGVNLRFILDILCRKRAKDWRDAEYSIFNLGDMAGPVGDVGVDLHGDPIAVGIVRSAQRRTRERLQGPAETYLNRLPLEILFMVARLLTSKDAHALQQGIGFYLGDGHWRARIPTILREALPLHGEPLNWPYMCLELERKDDDHYWRRRLDGRGCVVAQLDRILDYIKTGRLSSILEYECPAPWNDWSSSKYNTSLPNVRGSAGNREWHFLGESY